jgi:hypothetical protein
VVFHCRNRKAITENKVELDKKEETSAAIEPKERHEEGLKKPSPPASLFTAQSICIEDRSDEQLIDITSDVQKDIGYQVYVKNCNNSTISVRTTIGSARLENLRNCQVYLGPCCTSTYVENCTGCTFFIRCHQLRIHHAYSSSFYVYVNSHPIIEDCTTLSFAPYTATYPTLQQDVEVSSQAGGVWLLVMSLS